jgi:NADPH:quinone reductase-like Zn-dependent oxidoreductase
VKAILYDQWGGPGVLRLADIAPPAPAPGEVVVRVMASSVNAWDWDLLTGKPYFIKPRGFDTGPKRLGFDVAGIVEAVGTGVTRFGIGDAVYGDLAFAGPGALAEFVAVKQTALARKPAAMDFADAAALPQAGLLALQGLGGEGGVRAGSRVLINGAGGGAGSVAIQLAKLAGAHVTGVDSAGKLGAMRDAGADDVIDFAATDFTATGATYDQILDVIANRPLRHFVRALAPAGRLSIVGGTPGVLFRALTAGPILGLATGKSIRLVIHRPAAADLDRLSALYERGVVRPLIDSVFPLERTADAFARFATGQAVGKVVVTVAG